MTYWDDVNLDCAASSYRPKGYLGFLRSLINIKTRIVTALGREFVTLAQLNAAKHAVHEHHCLRSQKQR